MTLGQRPTREPFPLPLSAAWLCVQNALSGSLTITLAGAGSQADVKRSCGRA
jgi:hypothetical protein